MPAGAPSRLTPDVLAKAIELANLGLPFTLIAKGLGVANRTFYYWLKKGKEREPETLEFQLLQGINRATAKIAQDHLCNLSQQSRNGSTAAATWMLTHHPLLRDQFSDAAADRRVEKRTIATVIEAITAAGLPQEHETRLLLSMQARGLSMQHQEQDPGDQYPGDQDPDDHEGDNASTPD